MAARMPHPFASHVTTASRKKRPSDSSACLDLPATTLKALVWHLHAASLTVPACSVPFRPRQSRNPNLGQKAEGTPASACLQKAVSSVQPWACFVDVCFGPSYGKYTLCNASVRTRYSKTCMRKLKHATSKHLGGLPRGTSTQVSREMVRRTLEIHGFSAHFQGPHPVLGRWAVARDHSSPNSAHGH